MSITMILAGFGGGLFAAAIGGVPSFIFTGLVAIIAILAGDAGVPGLNVIAFGPWFMPCAAFSGAAAAAAYAKKTGKLENGMDIIKPLAGLQDPMTLLVGGIFGSLGVLINYLVSGFGNLAWTDTVACSVVVSGIIARLVFTKSGLTGKAPEGTERSYFANGKDLKFLLVLGLGYGILSGGIVGILGSMAYSANGAVVSEVAAYLFKDMGLFAFGIAAVGLVLSCCNLPFYACHHIIYPAASTAILIFSATLSPIAAVVGGALMGMLTTWLGDVMGRTFNSYTDSHIDPPACTIFVVQILNFSILPLIFHSMLV